MSLRESAFHIPIQYTYLEHNLKVEIFFFIGVGNNSLKVCHQAIWGPVDMFATPTIFALFWVENISPPRKKHTQSFNPLTIRPVVVKLTNWNLSTFFVVVLSFLKTLNYFNLREETPGNNSSPLN